MTVVSADCSNPPTVANTSTNVTDSSTYTEGSVVRYDCELGYSTAGKSRMFTCSGTEWSGGDIQCEQIHCSYIAPPENGQIATDSPTYEVGSSLTFSCDVGHDMTGESSLTCLVNGLWSPATVAPTCNAKDCGDFGPIQYANTFQDSSDVERNHYGSIVVVTCKTGYVVDGSPSVSCLANGQWGARPTCVPMTCSLYPNTDSSCMASTRILGQLYHILCKSGADVSVTRLGADNAECLNTGWDTLDMACFCDCYVNVASNILTFNNLNTNGFLPHGEDLQWTCNKPATRSSSSLSASCADGIMRVQGANAVVQSSVNGATITGFNVTGAILESILCDTSDNGVNNSSAVDNFHYSFHGYFMIIATTSMFKLL